jgi:hypothetical protein
LEAVIDVAHQGRAYGLNLRLVVVNENRQASSRPQLSARSISWQNALAPICATRMTSARIFRRGSRDGSRRVTGRPVQRNICPRRAGDPAVLVSDSSKARASLSWTPQFPSLDQQIAHCLVVAARTASAHPKATSLVAILKHDAG